MDSYYSSTNSNFEFRRGVYILGKIPGKIMFLEVFGMFTRIWCEVMREQREIKAVNFFGLYRLVVALLSVVVSSFCYCE